MCYTCTVPVSISSIYGVKSELLFKWWYIINLYMYCTCVYFYACSLYVNKWYTSCCISYMLVNVYSTVVIMSIWHQFNDAYVFSHIHVHVCKFTIFYILEECHIHVCVLLAAMYSHYNYFVIMPAYKLYWYHATLIVPGIKVLLITSKTKSEVICMTLIQYYNRDHN